MVYPMVHGEPQCLNIMDVVNLNLKRKQNYSAVYEKCIKIIIQKNKTTSKYSRQNNDKKYNFCKQYGHCKMKGKINK